MKHSKPNTNIATFLIINKFLGKRIQERKTTQNRRARRDMEEITKNEQGISNDEVSLYFNIQYSIFFHRGGAGNAEKISR